MVYCCAPLVFTLFLLITKSLFPILPHIIRHSRLLSFATVDQSKLRNFVECIGFVILRVLINKIGRRLSGSPICLLTSMITDRIGLHKVLLQNNHNHCNFREMNSYQQKRVNGNYDVSGKPLDFITNGLDCEFVAAKKYTGKFFSRINCVSTNV